MVSHLPTVFRFPNSVKLLCNYCGNGDSCNTESSKLANSLRPQLYGLFPSSKVCIFSLGFQVRGGNQQTDMILEGYLCLLLVLILVRLMLISLRHSSGSTPQSFSLSPTSSLSHLSVVPGKFCMLLKCQSGVRVRHRQIITVWTQFA